MADEYLRLARQVLLIHRVPLSPREILKQAYLAGLVPTHLFGTTQHKTLQARLSEDILHRRDRSAFFRTDPGRFFLRELIIDNTIPQSFKREYVARRRSKEVRHPRVLVVDRYATSNYNGIVLDVVHFCDILSSAQHKYIHRKELCKKSDLAQVVSFVMVIKDAKILTHRAGSYSTSSDELRGQKAIGFRTTVSDIDLDLFNDDKFGLINAAIRELEEIGLSSRDVYRARYDDAMRLMAFINLSSETNLTNSIGAAITFGCSSEFEPTRMRLGINDLRWMPLTHRPNQMSDFDAWSRSLLDLHFSGTISLSQWTLNDASW